VPRAKRTERGARASSRNHRFRPERRSAIFERPAGGHDLHRERPVEVNERLRRFLGEQIVT